MVGLSYFTTKDTQGDLPLVPRALCGKHPWWPGMRTNGVGMAPPWSDGVAASRAPHGLTG